MNCEMLGDARKLLWRLGVANCGCNYQSLTFVVNYCIQTLKRKWVFIDIV
jgi:hypothetical protein